MAGGTLVLVSHDLTTLSDWCPRVLWLDRGQVRRLAPAPLVIREYLLETARGMAPVAGANGLATLRRVRLSDGRGRTRHVFSSTDALAAALDYRIDRPVSEPAFGLMICREDWTCCFGTDTRVGGAALPPAGVGEGTAVLRLEPLQLLPGRYFVSASLLSSGGIVDFSPALATFTVAGPAGDLGVFRPHHRWELFPPPGEGALGQLREPGRDPAVQRQAAGDQERRPDQRRDQAGQAGPGSLEEDLAVSGHEAGDRVGPQDVPERAHSRFRAARSGCGPAVIMRLAEPPAREHGREPMSV